MSERTSHLRQCRKFKLFIILIYRYDAREAFEAINGAMFENNKILLQPIGALDKNDKTLASCYGKYDDSSSCSTTSWTTKMQCEEQV